MKADLTGKLCPVCLAAGSQTNLLGGNYQEADVSRFSVCCDGCYKSNTIVVPTMIELTRQQYLEIGYDLAISQLGTPHATPVIVI